MIGLTDLGNIVAGDNETSMISEGTPLEYWTSENIANLKQKLVGYINAAGLTYCTSCN